MIVEMELADDKCIWQKNGSNGCHFWLMGMRWKNGRYLVRFCKSLAADAGGRVKGKHVDP